MKRNVLNLASNWLVALQLSLTAAFAASDVTVTGHVLLEELSCTACHAATAKQAEWLSPKTAPRLANIGSRASAEWLQRHLIAPHQAMPGTTMPDVLRGNSEHAEALTHYLLSLAPVKFQRVMPDLAAVARGEDLYHRIGVL